PKAHAETGLLIIKEQELRMQSIVADAAGVAGSAEIEKGIIRADREPEAPLQRRIPLSQRSGSLVHHRIIVQVQPHRVVGKGGRHAEKPTTVAAPAGKVAKRWTGQRSQAARQDRFRPEVLGTFREGLRQRRTAGEAERE